ncbi:MAG: 5-formyltetrahydrofolate cyclo-ligase [Eubacterium sp.]|nr:5-formyltetrahydrofolate cyclo-ligase [Eubacterium sp.]
MQTPDLTQLKKETRTRIRRAMRALDPGEKSRIDEAICRQAAAQPQFLAAGRIFCFLGIDWEINTDALIDAALAAGKEVYLPLVTGPGIMEARRIYDRSELVPGAYDIPEPPQNSPAADPSEIELAIVPCVSCDRSCMRLGQGGGFYDRFLEHASFYTIALCREDALLDEVPAEPWDSPVDCVITENHIFYKEENEHGIQI